METTPPPIIVNDAVSQRDRRPAALAAGRAPVDGRSLDDRLAFAPSFGRLVAFYDLDDVRDGDWSSFYLSDPTIALAALRTFDGASAGAELRRLEQRARDAVVVDEKFRRLRHLFAFGLDVARGIDGALHYPPLAAAVAAMVERRLSARLRPLKGYALGAGLPGALEAPVVLDYEGFLPLWGLDGVTPDGSIYRGSTIADRMDSAVAPVATIAGQFLVAVAELRSHAEPMLAEGADQGRHQPHAALFIAFAGLLGEAQATLNRFSRRYVDFYYRRVLKEQPAGPVADHLYLTVTVTDDAPTRGVFLPRGTLFPAGQDADGNPVLYATDRDLTATAAALAAVRMVRVVPSPQAPMFLLSSEIDLAAPVDGMSLGWETFGGDRPGTLGRQTTVVAEIGFAVASPLLELTGGTRDITVTLVCAEPGPAEAVLEAAFALSLSTAEGWFAVPSYTARVTDTRIALHLALPPSVPAIVAREGAGDDEPPADAGPVPTVPTLRAVLRQGPITVDGLEIFPLAVLGKVVVTSVEIAVAVSGLAPTAVYNTDSEVDTGQPFPVLGGLPVLGSYMALAQPEIFAKTPRSVTLDIAWFDLPTFKHGFTTYYRDYVIGPDGRRAKGLFDNAVFEGTISALDAGTWTVVPAAAPLFRTRQANPAPPPAELCVTPPAPAGRLCDTSSFPLTPVAQSVPLGYDPSSSRLCLTLTSPPYAFGSDLYDKAVLNAVIQDLPIPASGLTGATAGCQAFLDAATIIAVCQKQCVGPDYVECIKACLQQAQGTLLEAAGDTLAESLASNGTPVDEEVRARLKTASVERMQRLVDHCDGMVGASSARKLTEVAGCIDSCLAITDPEQLRACLDLCRATLLEAYSHCLRDSLKYPNPPWLPQAAKVTLSYTADGGGSFHHLLPFDGWREASPGGNDDCTLVPVYASEGNLYLGFSGIVPPQPLTLLLRLAADGDAQPVDPAVRWAYLADNAWHELDGTALRFDETNSLRNTGTMMLALPPYAPGPSTIMPGALNWIGARTATGASGFPTTVGIHADAVTASWNGGGTGLDLAVPVPAHTITAPLEAIDGVDSVDQPIASFGGRPPETERVFETRLGERLRHKDRAIQGWDYERLTLERFPAILKARTLAAVNAAGEPAPGGVLLTVVPGPDGAEVADPTVPQASPDLLERIRMELSAVATTFVNLHVVNPAYVRITVVATVLFVDGMDTGAAAERLDRDLVVNLSPWTHDGPDAMASVTETGISDFIQTRPYVEALTSLKLEYDPPLATVRWCFLTSAQSHRIAVDGWAAAPRRRGY